MNGEPPSTLYAPLGFLAAATGLRPYRSFDGTTNWSMIWTGIMPGNYNAVSTKVRVWGTMSAGNAGTKVIKLEAQFERCESGVVLGAAGNDFAAAQSSETTVNNTAGTEFICDVSFTAGAQMDSVVAGDLFRLRVVRNNTTSGTNATGAFRMLAAAVIIA